MAAISRLHKFGRNADVDLAASETVWDGGGPYVWQTTAETLEASSGDEADTADGTGAQTLMLSGLDDQWDWIDETITMNGSLAVPTTKQFFRNFRNKCMTAGSGGVNAGIITVTAPVAGLTLAAMEAGVGQSQLAIYSVARYYRLHIRKIFISSFKSQSAAYEVRQMRRKDGESWQLKGTYGGHTTGGPVNRIFNPPVIVEEKTDIEFIADTTANDIGISVEFDGILERMEAYV